MVQQSATGLSVQAGFLRPRLLIIVPVEWHQDGGRRGGLVPERVDEESRLIPVLRRGQAQLQQQQ